MINNLFVVQSPLQALCAVELSLEFDSQSNAVVYRLENGRERKVSPVASRATVTSKLRL